MTNSNSYVETRVKTASPQELVLMLYEGLIKFLNQSIEKMRKGDIEESGRLIVRSERIINELIISVKPEAGSISKNLISLYNYMYQLLIQANIKKDEENIRQVLNLVVPLCDAWKKICEKSSNSECSAPVSARTLVDINL
jgi:flagellar secretion chaperone FliS